MKQADKTKDVIAKQEDGTVQITITIPWKTIKEETSQVAEDLAKSASIPGFRKGKAPVEKVVAHTDKDSLMEKVLQKLLPSLVGKSLETHKIAPIIYPKFELIKAKEGEDWQIRAITCELPNFSLGDYKKEIKGAIAAKSITKKDSQTKEEKEQIAITTLLETVKLSLPKLLVEEEVNSRLASLLARIEKLGLSLDSYLTSIGKTPQSIRDEYTKQAEKDIKLEVLLNKIAREESIKPTQEEVNSFIEAAKGDPSFSKGEDGEQARLVSSILQKRKAIDIISSL